MTIHTAARAKTVARPTQYRELTALVIDDSPADRQAIQRILKDAGIEVQSATSGADAIAMSRQEQPDIVFCAMPLPDMSGDAVVQAVRTAYPSVYIPVIFVTAHDDEESLLRCFESGGDEVVVKPANPALLRARLDVVLRLRELHVTVARQRDELASYRAEIQRDLGIAKSILDNLATSDSLAAPNVRHVLRPMETLNGDFIMAARAPSSRQAFLIGDFTGHGLPAAIGVLVVQGVFVSMVAKGLSLEAIATELNRKMYNLLPVDRFLSAALIEVDPDGGMISVWNGGLPDILVHHVDTGGLTRFRSTNLPLGVLPGEDFDAIARKGTLHAGDRIYACSDGVLEATGPDGTMFGVERFKQCIVAGGAGAFERILQALDGFMQDARPHDDVSLLEVRYDPDVMQRAGSVVAMAPVGKAATAWRVSTDLGIDAIRNGDPLPVLTTFADVLQGFGQRSAEIYLVVSELYSNALEHGLLGLDSALKRSPQGFADYYEQRQTQLARVRDGTVTITLTHTPTPSGGSLEIRVRNTGIPFDPTVAAPSLKDNGTSSGRGIALVRSLCASLEYEDDGRVAVALYTWVAGAAAARAA